MVKLKTKSVMKKVISFLLVMVMTVCSIPITAFAADMNLGQINSRATIDINVEKHYGHELHTTKLEGQTFPLFCIEYGKKSPTSSSLASQGVPTDAKVLEAARWIFAGYYMVHGNNIDWLDMAYCQKKVWSILGSNSSWDFSNDGYNAWCNNAQNNMSRLDTRPSFDGKNLNTIIGNILAGTSKTIPDTNGVLKDYPAFTQDSNGVKIIHNANSNELTITVDKSCKQTSFAILDNKYYKTITGIDSDCLLYNPKAGGTQKLLYSAYYDPISFAFNGNITPLGSIEITKKDNWGANVDGAEFGIYTDKNCTNRIATSTSKGGKVVFNELAPNTYYVKEIKAPKSYLLNNDVVTVVVKSNETSKNTVTNAEALGNIELTKKLDVSKTNGKYGDVKIDEATYTLKARNDIKSETGSKTFYKKDQTISTKSVTSTDGTTAKITWENLPLGSYYIVEENEPTGAFLDKKEYDVELEYVNQTTPIVINDKTVSTDLVKSMKVKVFKAGTNGGAGVIQGLQGAEFTIKLNADYEKALQEGYKYEEIWSFKDKTGTWKGINIYGKTVNVDASRAEKANAIAPSYDKITTDKNGIAVSNYLPYGRYIGKETFTPVDYVSGSDFLFSITEDETEVSAENKVKYIAINNTPYKVPVKIIKKDVNSDKIVTLSSATFKIKATENIYDTDTGKVLFAKGDYVQYKIGNNKYNEFMTNSDGFVVPATGNTYASKNDEKGTVTTPFKLPAGKYEIVEITAPEGFLISKENKPFIVTSIYDYDKDADGEAVITITVKNEQPKGNIIINKTFDKRENIDKTLIENYDYTKIGFELSAANDIVDKADGSIIYKKGQVIDKYYLNKEGKLSIKGLWIGEYSIKEISTINGAILDNTAHTISFKVTDNTTKGYTKTLDIINYTTEVDISKEDVAGSEVEGAKLTVKDKNGNVIDSWTSTDKPHKIEGLNIGEIYILHEEFAPNGYVIANDVEFTVTYTKEIQSVQMIDKQVAVSKTDVTTGDELEGAELTVTDAEGNIVDSWVSSTTPHYVTGLVEGQTYVLSEKLAPNGYVIANDIEFTVTYTKEIQSVQMIDKQLAVSKTDVTTGGELEGAELTVTDAEGNIVDSWVSTTTPHYVTGLVEGQTYILSEKLSPNGYTVANDIEFTVTYTKDVQSVVMVDKVVTVSKTDVENNLINGAELIVTNNRTKQIVDKWITGQHLIDITDEMKDILLNKQEISDFFIDEDDSTVKYVVKPTEKDNDYSLMLQSNGVTNYYIIDIEGNETIHMLRGLIEGEDYLLAENKAPNMFVVATPISFDVTEDKENQNIQMIDKQVAISKTDVTTGDELEGAELTVTDKEGNVVDSWISTTTPHYVTGLVEGQTYTLTEVKAPYSYDVAESIEFTVSADKEVQKVNMEDDYIYSSVRVVKCDITTKQPIVSNEFEFSIFADKDCKELIATSGANKDEGTALFEKLKYGTYYISETKAPLGYTLSEQVVEIVINDTGVYADGVSLEGNNGVYSFEYYDELLPVIETGDNSNNVKSLIIMGVLLVVFVIIFILVSKKMKNNNKNK